MPAALVPRGVRLGTGGHAVARAFVTHTGELTPPALVARNSRSCIAKAVLSPTNLRALNTGGAFVPPLLFRAPCVPERLRDRFCKRGSPHHGGLRPPALVRARSLADGIVTFTMHKRTCTGAAGVSPPCDRETPLQRRGANARETAAGVLTNAGAIAVAKPRGAYARSSCSRAFARRRNCDLCDARTHFSEKRAKVRSLKRPFRCLPGAGRCDPAASACGSGRCESGGRRRRGL